MPFTLIVHYGSDDFLKIILKSLFRGNNTKKFKSAVCQWDPSLQKIKIKNE